ncbi:MAG: phospholipase D family protein [Pseudorhodobacter sp.]|nr:phospholipase D family protein [Pseudorhodobacter sp.]
MDFVGHTEIDGAFARLRQSRRLYCAVAFWGRGAAAHLGLPRDHQDLQILCNLSMGGTNPDEIRRLLQVGAKVQQIDTLHAKVYIGDDEMLVASANASSNGLGFEGHAQGHWIEAGAIGPVQPQALEWFQKLWSDSRPVTPDDLAAADEAWATRQRNRPPLASFSLFDVEAQPLLLLDWYGDKDWTANETVVAEQLGEAYSDEIEDRLGDALDVVGPQDVEVLKEGRWVLRWTRTKGSRNKGKVGPAALEWMQIGQFVEKAYHSNPKGPWVDVMMPAEGDTPVPFDVCEPRFRAAFVNVLEQPTFDLLRVGQYDGPWNTPERTARLQPFWHAVKARYLAEV